MEAEDAYRAALKLRTQLVRDFPRAPEYRQDLARSQSDMGGLLELDVRRRAAAEAAYRGALKIQAQLVRDFPAVPEYREGLARIHGNLAILLRDLGKRAEEQDAFREALKIQAQLAHDFPSVPRYRMELATSHNNLADLLRDQGKRAEAEDAYHEALRLRSQLAHDFPNLPQDRTQLAETLIRLGQFKEAEQAFQEALELAPSDHWVWFRDAPLRLQLGDVEGYRRACREMLAQFSQTHEAMIAERTAKTCLLIPDAVADLQPVIQLADRAVTGTEKHQYYGWFLLVKGMADYRTGHFAEAIDRLKKIFSLSRERRYHISAALHGTVYLFLAMAHHRLDQGPQARQALAQASAIMEQTDSKGDHNTILGPEWHDWLRFQIVRHEAERLVKGSALPIK
jgi:tetratricopeptide (TPR) repeat protein